MISRPVGPRKKMKSIQKKITPHFFNSIMSSSLQKGATRFTLWFYPETTERERKRIIGRLQGFIRRRELVEPVTLYWDNCNDEGAPVEEMPITFKLSSASIDKLTTHFNKLIRTCDSVATYCDDNHSFRCAVIFHERQVLLPELL